MTALVVLFANASISFMEMSCVCNILGLHTSCLYAVLWSSQMKYANMSKAFILHFSSLWCTSKSICTLYIRTSTGLCDSHLALNFNVYRSTTNILSNNKSCGKQLLHVDWRGTVACRLYSLSCIHRSRFQWDWCHGHARPQQLPQWKCGSCAVEEPR